MREKCVENAPKFYKKLHLYKSILYRNVKFKTNSKDNEFVNIVTALNIKNRKKRIAFIYDYCCKTIDDFYKDKNVCDFKNNQCIAQRVPGCTYKNGCCRLCPYQSTTGCKTANLTCKFFYCSTVRKKHKVLTPKELKILKLYSLRQRFILRDDFFSTREEVIFDLYLASIILYAMRIVGRMIKNLRMLKKSEL